MKKFFAGLISLAAALLAVCAITVCAGAETSGDYEYSVLRDGTVEITDYYGSATELEIPPTLDGKKVTSIGFNAFGNCSSLTSITIPNGVTTIVHNAFWLCSNLTTISIPNSVTSIGYNAFFNTPFLNNQTTTVKYAGKWVIGCDEDAETANIKSGMVGIADEAFYYCDSLSSVTLPDSVTIIGSMAFACCLNLTSIIIPDSVTSMGSGAFSHCFNLNSVTIPNSLTNITMSMFSGCTSLTAVTIPDSVTSIETRAFQDCSSLKDVYFTGSEANWYKIFIEEYLNDNLLKATIHYNHIPSPSSVTGLKLKSRAADALRISWTKNTSADGYIIEMKSGNSWTRVGKITNNSTIKFKKSKLKAGTAYTFRIKAYKMSGKTALYSDYTTISARTNPSAISGLKLKARAADALSLTWTKNTSADGYIVEMKSGSTWTRVGKITKNSTVEFKKSKLKAGTAYTFRIKAYKMSGKTALYGATKTISVRTNPSAVAGLKLKASAKDAVRLSWTKNTSADGYIIEMKSGNAWTRVAKITKNSTVEFKKSKLKAGTAYTFRIKAYKMSGKTALYGATKSITVKTK